MRIFGGTDRGDLDCAEKDEISAWHLSHLLCRALISRCLKATGSERSTPSSLENRMGETGEATVSRRARCSLQLAILTLELSFTIQAATQKVESIPVPGTK